VKAQPERQNIAVAVAVVVVVALAVAFAVLTTRNNPNLINDLKIYSPENSANQGVKPQKNATPSKQAI